MRGSGKTTDQIRTAPHGAVFVWCQGDLHYPVQLARDLKRDDLLIVKPSWLEYKNIAGRRFKGLVLDHALTPTEEQWQIIKWIELDTRKETSGWHS